MENIAVFNKITYPIIRFRIPKNNIKNEEGKYVFVGKVYGLMNINDDFLKVLEFLDNFEVLNQEEILTANDGVYNWILYSEKDSKDIKFAATQIESPYEIGTTHQSLAYNKKVNASLIYGAGELKIEDRKVTFNVLSGTYTYNIQISTFDFDRIVTRQIIDKFIELFPESIYEDCKDSYVHSLKTVSNKLLELYKKIKFTVRLFDEYNDWVEFSNQFWSIDFRIEYFEKKLEDENENQNVMRIIYMKSLETMINLLEPK